MDTHSLAAGPSCCSDVTWEASSGQSQSVEAHSAAKEEGGTGLTYPSPGSGGPHACPQRPP